MLHELLFALNGFPGHTFMLIDGKFKVNEAIPYFHPAEIGILNQLLDIATDYWKIEDFIKKHNNTVFSTGQNNEGLHGMYVQALCSGLEEVLEPYRQTLIDLEKSVLKNKTAQLSFIQHKVFPFQPVLRNIYGLIQQIQFRKAHGCFILDFIYKSSCSGVANVKEAMQRLLHECHKVLYKQLLRWILQGNLYDPFEEFFVKPVENKDDKSEEEVSELVNKFQLRVEMIPCHISVSTAEKIFFIGESIQLFERDRDLEDRGGVLKDQEAEFYNQLAELSDSLEFRVADFERFVDTVRETASRHLHTLVLDNADLRQELDILRSFYLLGRGELFQAFIEETESYLQIPPNAATEYDVRQSFMAIVRKLWTDSDTLANKVKVELTNYKPASNEPKKTGWECLSLTYSVPWPLHLIISPKVLSKYNEVFRFLLLAKRTQLMLHSAWTEQKQNKRQLRFTDTWQLRNHMMFVVDNLQYYLMADVLESQFCLLMNRLDHSTTFEEWRHAHDIFLSSVISNTFVNNQPVNQCLTEMLHCCLQYCKLVDLQGDSKSPKFEELATNFSRQSSLLFKLLSSIKSRQTGSQLAQLLLRIDYNRYFSTYGHDIGKVTELSAAESTV